MKKLLSFVLTILLLLCSQFVGLASGIEEDLSLDSVREMNLSFDPARTQRFTFTNSNSIVWGSIPSENLYKNVDIFIYPGLVSTTISNSVHAKHYKRNDKSEQSMEIPLPKLEDGVYRLVLRASETKNTPPYDRYQMLVAVSGGKYYFAQRSLSPGSDLARKIKEAAEEYLSDKAYMGISIGIVKDGEVLFLNCGHANEGGEEITENHIFGLASVTKTFTGIVVADLAHRGLLSLDDPLEKYTGFPVGLDGTEVRLIDLITHTSGLPPEPKKMSVNEARAMTNDMLLEYLKTEKPSTKPGELYSYSNLGYAILGYVIERVTCQTYEEAVKEIILDKLGMSSTAASLTNEQEARRAAPHSAKNDATEKRNYIDGWVAVGGLNSTAYDLTRYIMANLRLTTTATGRLEDALELAQRIHRSAADEKGNPKLMGLGWEQRRLKKETNIYNVIHAGKSSGYRSAVVISQNLNGGVVVLCNDESSTLSPYEVALLLLDIIRDYQ